MAAGSWADAALHQYYTEVRDLQTLVGRATPLLDRIRKNSMVDGSATGLFFTLQGGMGMAGDLASAQVVSAQSGTGLSGGAAGASTLDGEWLLPTGQIETSLILKYKDLVRGKSNKGAYLRNLTHETDKHGEYFGERLAQLIMRPSGYPLAQVDVTDEDAGIITCLVPSDIANIYKGMILVASANDGSTSTDTLLDIGTPGSLGRAIVESVDRDAGTFVVTTTNAANDLEGAWGADGTDVYVFPLGQFRPTLPGATFNDKLMIQTLSEWLTPSAATDTFGTVDRSADSALSGVRIPTATISAMSIENKLQFAAAYMQSRFAGRKAPTFVLQTEQWFELVRSLQAQGIVGDLGAKLKTGGRAVELATVNGVAEVIAEPHQDPNFFYGLIPEEIEIRHLDGLPGVANADGLEMLRQSDSNNLEFRLISFPQLVMREPWLHCRGSLL